MNGPRPLGISGIDEVVGPVLPPGWLAILVGHEGSDTHLFAKQFARAGAGETPVMYYTTYERTVDVEQAFRDHGWDPDGVRIVNLAEEYYERVLARSLDISRIRERGLTLQEVQGRTPPVGKPVRFNLMNRILGELAGLEAPFRLALDSLDFLLEVIDPPEVIAFARQVAHRAHALGGEALLVVHSGLHPPRTTGLLEQIADLVLDLGTEAEGASFRQVLRLRRLRNRPEAARRFLLTSGEEGLSARGAEGRGGSRKD